MEQCRLLDLNIVMEGEGSNAGEHIQWNLRERWKTGRQSVRAQDTTSTAPIQALTRLNGGTQGGTTTPSGLGWSGQKGEGPQGDRFVNGTREAHMALPQVCAVTLQGSLQNQILGFVVRICWNELFLELRGLRWHSGVGSES